MSKKLKINYRDYTLYSSKTDFVPNWTTAVDDKGKKFTCKEEAMLYAIRLCLGKGAVMIWNKQVFTP